MLKVGQEYKTISSFEYFTLGKKYYTFANQPNQVDLNRPDKQSINP